MKVAKVIGNIWATRKEEKLAGLKLLLVQPLDVLTGKAERPPRRSTAACSPDGEAPRRPGGNFRERNGHTS